MNKKIISLILISALMWLGACKKFLNVQPQFEFTSTIATSSLDGLAKTTIGAFNSLQSGNLYGGGIIANSELLADFISADPIADYGLAQLRSREMNAYNTQSGPMWSSAYYSIYVANVVLQYLPKYASQNPPQAQLLKGECYFIRGIMHFELLRMFAEPSGYTPNDSHLGVPLQLVPSTISTGQSTGRSTVRQCYTQIESDLDSAVAYLPASPQTIASKAAAEAFLMRVYFTQHMYQQALAYADSVINTPGLALNDSVTTIYNTTGANWTPETVFQCISYSGDVSNGSLTGRFFWKPVQPAQDYCSSTFAQYLEADSAAGSLRFKELYRRAADGVGGPRYYWTTKYNDLTMSVTIIRLAEVYLTRAECEAQLGMPDAMVRSDYNKTRVRAGLLPDNTTSGQTALLNALRGERDMELAMEGDRFFEIKRRQISFIAPESGNYYDWNSPELVYPIPEQEIQQNPNMVQNPGY